MLNQNIFEEEDIVKSLDQSIRDLVINEKKLLDNRCSERALVHHLAKYFEYYLIHSKEFSVDVEYNRYGETAEKNVGNSKRLYNICYDCEYKKAKCCPKKKENGTIAIDMVFHRRGLTDLEDNVFCLEMKPPRIAANSKDVTCDIERVKVLVGIRDSQNSDSNPEYQYGAALHIISTDNNSYEARYHFFNHRKGGESVYSIKLGI